MFGILLFLLLYNMVKEAPLLFGHLKIRLPFTGLVCQSLLKNEVADVEGPVEREGGETDREVFIVWDAVWI